MPPVCAVATTGAHHERNTSLKIEYLIVRPSYVDVKVAATARFAVFGGFCLDWQQSYS